MGTVAEKLEYLNDTKEAIKNAIVAKGQPVADSDTFRSYASKISAIQTASEITLTTLTVSENGSYDAGENAGYSSVTVDVPSEEPSLDVLNVTPTGEYITETPGEGYVGFSSVTVDGDPNLTPENIAVGITIYGVEGSLSASASNSVPAAYETYVTQAAALYGLEYANTMVLENNGYVTVGLMSDDFAVTAYNSSTSEFSASGWYRAAYNKSLNSWSTGDFTSTASEGGNFIRNVRSCTTTITYDGAQIYPMSTGFDSGGSGGGGSAPSGMYISISASPISEVVVE